MHLMQVLRYTNKSTSVNENQKATVFLRSFFQLREEIGHHIIISYHITEFAMAPIHQSSAAPYIMYVTQ